MDEHAVQNEQRAPLHERAATPSDSVAWELDRLFRDRLCAYVDRMMNKLYKRSHSEEDIVQSVFRSFYRHTANGDYVFENTAKLWALLKTIAYHKILKVADKEHTPEPVDANLLPAAEVTEAQARLFGEVLEMVLKKIGSPAPEVFRLQLFGYTVQEVIEIVLSGLAPPYPEILALRLQGKSQRQIAEAIGSTREKVRGKLNRIQDRLTRLLTEAEAS